MPVCWASLRNKFQRMLPDLKGAIQAWDVKEIE